MGHPDRGKATLTKFMINPVRRFFRIIFIGLFSILINIILLELSYCKVATVKCIAILAAVCDKKQRMVGVWTLEFGLWPFVRRTISTLTTKLVLILQ